MGVSSSALQPQELITFKKLPTNVPLENIEIPEKPENRRPTNVKWLIILGLFILILMPFMIYTLYYSDAKRLLVGYDQCGNVCGKKNYKWEGISCSGQDFTYSPYLEYKDYVGGYNENDELDLMDRECVQSCKPDYIEIFGRCLKTDTNGHQVVSSSKTRSSDIDLGVYFASVKWQLIISCLLSILVAMGMLFLFRYAVAFVVWGILLGCLFGLMVLVGAFWYFYMNTPVTTSTYSKDDPKQVFLVLGVIFTIVAVVLGIVLIWCRKKIHLVILLLKEATKAIFDMPGLICVPIVCVISIFVLAFLFVTTTIFMESAGTLQRLSNGLYHYKPNAVMLFSIAYNFVTFLWLAQFFTGIQYMVIAGAVAKWYYARDKNFLRSPIFSSISITFKYHLGTVAFGSLLITIVQIIKSIILGLIKNDKCRAVVESCIEAIETFFKFLSKNAYIITAMHGQAFLRSGKRAARLIIQNISDIIAVNYIGDFVLGMAVFLIAIFSTLLSMGIFAMAPGPVGVSNIPSYFIVGFISLCVAATTFGVFETTIDTILICYCEDNLLNDGMAKPYFMSRNLKEFVQESKQVYGKK